MSVVSNDFTPIVPYTTDVLSIGAGQRTDVIVQANAGAAGSSYWMRIRQPDLCSYTLQPFGLAAVYYTDAAAKSIPDTTNPPASFNAPRLQDCRNDPLNMTVPSYAIPAASTPDTTLTIQGNVGVNASGNTVYTMNGKQNYADFQNPVLSLAANGQSFGPWNTYDMGTNQTIWLVFNNNMSFSHPMHLHGRQFLLLAEGVGAWDGRTIVRPTNPLRRDTHIVQGNGYMVIQLSGNDAGVWPFHCHIAWHLTSGMNVNLVLNKPAIVAQKTTINTITAATCSSWKTWAAAHPVEPVDSGFRIR